MPTHFAASPARFVRWSALLAVTLSCVGIECVQAEPIFSVGDKETMYTSSQRKKKAASWPDGNFGVISNGDGTYDFYAANSSKIKVTTGTLDDPAAKKVGTGKISASRRRRTTTFPADQFTKTKRPAHDSWCITRRSISGAGTPSIWAWPCRSIRRGWTSSTLARSSRRTSRSDRIPIPPISAAERSPSRTDNSTSIFETTWRIPRTVFRAELAVARAPLDELMSNSINGNKTSFTKYYNGDWTEPGIGGRSSPLEVGNPANWWASVSYNDYLDQMVLVSSQWQAGGTGPDLYMATSPDGVNWSARQPLVLDAGEQMYPTIVGTGADPQVTGQSFYVYYTDGSRWSNASCAATR